MGIGGVELQLCSELGEEQDLNRGTRAVPPGTVQMISGGDRKMK